MARKKPRLVILISNGILENVIADQELELEVLKVDVDEQAEVETIYRLQAIEVNPQAVEDNFQEADKFWTEEEKSSARAGEPEG